MERLSKSELKRQHKQIETAAREIILLNAGELGDLSLSTELIDSVMLCRNLKGGALKRQTKYVTKLLKQEPIDEIFRLLAKLKGSKLEENRFHHEAERHRDAIINEALEARDAAIVLGEPMEMDWQSQSLDTVVLTYPEVDEKDLRRSAYQYVKSRNKVHHRELFRMIRAAAEKQRFRNKT